MTESVPMLCGLLKRLHSLVKTSGHPGNAASDAVTKNHLHLNAGKCMPEMGKPRPPGLVVVQPATENRHGLVWRVATAQRLVCPGATKKVSSEMIREETLAIAL